MENKSLIFEQGPIRPPNESRSLLLRFTRNCPWNRCTFCPVYKRHSFSRRSLEAIFADIDVVRAIIDHMQDSSRSRGDGGKITDQLLSAIMSDPSLHNCYRQVAVWYAYGNGNVFIQDANSLIMRTADLVSALQYLRARVPGVKRVTSYGRSTTIAKKSPEEMRELHEAGLDRIHIGLESGSDRVLRLVKKGSTAKDHIGAGRRVIEAGMTLSEYIMPGLGGRELSREHAQETAHVLNSIAPHFIRLRSLRIPRNTPLYLEKAAGGFQPLTDDETVQEIRLLVQSLEGIPGTILASDHFMNLLQEVEGTFPQDKAAMLAVIDRYLSMPEDDRLLYRLGRRGGALQSLDDLDDPTVRSRLDRARRNLIAESGGDIEKIISELADQYI